MLSTRSQTAAASKHRQSVLPFGQSKPHVTKPRKNLKGKEKGLVLSSQEIIKEVDREREEEVEVEEVKGVIKVEDVTGRDLEMFWDRLKGWTVHQEDLSLGEKVLRYFDANQKFGPCVGITRWKRWERAEKLGLRPPREALLALKKEGEQRDDAQDAHIDALLNPRLSGKA